MTSQPDAPKMLTLPERLRMKADMITMGERIEFGSECLIMHEAAEEIERLKKLAYHKGGTTYQSMFACTLDAMDENDRLKRQVEVLGAAIRGYLALCRDGLDLYDALAAANKIGKE